MAKVKVNTTLDEELVTRMDSYADDNYMSRATLITIAVNQYLNQYEVSKALKNMSLAMRKIADTGTIDEETMKQLDDFERLSRLLTGNL